MIRKQKILILESDVNSEKYACALKEHGYIIKVTDGKEYLEDVRSFDPDVILVDSDTYSNNRYICRELKLNKDTKDIPVLIISPTNVTNIPEKDLSETPEKIRVDKDVLVGTWDLKFDSGNLS